MYASELVMLSDDMQLRVAALMKRGWEIYLPDRDGDPDIPVEAVLKNSTASGMPIIFSGTTLELVVSELERTFSA